MASTPPGATAPPAPGSLVIPLPPGMTPAQFESLQGSVVTIAITTAVAFGILLWDHLNLFPDEIELYRSSRKKTWHSPSAWAFIILRYSGILATFPSLFFTSIQTQHCQLAVSLSSSGAVVVVAASGIIFSYRTLAIWGGNKIVYGILGFFYLAMLGCWIADATQYKAVIGPPTSFGSNCQMLPIVSWAPISYSSSVAFDSIVVILSLSKLNVNRLQKKSEVGFLVYRDNLLYFIFTAVTNITVLAIQAQGQSLDLVKPTAVPFSTLITTTMGARVFLNLKLFDQRKARERQNSSLPLSSTSTSSRGYGGSYSKTLVHTPSSTLPPTHPLSPPSHIYSHHPEDNKSKATLTGYDVPLDNQGLPQHYQEAIHIERETVISH